MEGVDARECLCILLTRLASRLLGLLVSIERKAMKDFTFSDGTFIPKGTTIGVATRCVHHDEKLYENANVFEPFRFSEIHEDDSESVKCQFVSTAIEYLAFGHGKNAWCVAFISSYSTDSRTSDCPIALDVSSLRTR
jgi:hypothetical protein